MIITLALVPLKTLVRKNALIGSEGGVIGLGGIPLVALLLPSGVVAPLDAEVAIGLGAPAVLVAVTKSQS